MSHTFYMPLILSVLQILSFNAYSDNGISISHNTREDKCLWINNNNNEIITIMICIFSSPCKLDMIEYIIELMWQIQILQYYRELLEKLLQRTVSTYLPMKYVLQIFVRVKFNIDVHSWETSRKTCYVIRTIANIQWIYIVWLFV